LQIWMHGLAVAPNHGHRGNAGDCASRRTSTATHKYFSEQGDKIDADDDSEAQVAALLLLLLRLLPPSNAIWLSSIFATGFFAAPRPA
jgi:cation transporter-like permease